MQLDAVAVFGYEDDNVTVHGETEALVAQYYLTKPLYDDELDTNTELCSAEAVLPLLAVCVWRQRAHTRMHLLSSTFYATHFMFNY